MVVPFLPKISTMLLAESPSSLPGRLGALEAVEDGAPPPRDHDHQRYAAYAQPRPQTAALALGLGGLLPDVRGMGRCWTK